jgi:predicted TIM-barrel fold metal-dependent hydrolase
MRPKTIASVRPPPYSVRWPQIEPAAPQAYRPAMGSPPYYDTCVYEPSTLSALVRQVGPERILMGSDWPVGEADPVGFVECCPELADPGARAGVLGATAGGLLGLG